MPKLSYWVAECESDSKVYSLRAKRKKDIQALFDSGQYEPKRYGPIKKVSFEYSDAFDLVEQCLNEGGGFWES